MITARRTEELDAMLARFEEQYEADTDRLTRLTARLGRSRSLGHELTEIISCRRALAATARVLQRMADADFGRCAQCALEISIDRLRISPESRLCAGCQPVPSGKPALSVVSGATLR